MVVVVHVSVQVVELDKLEVTVEEQLLVKETLVALVNHPHIHMAVELPALAEMRREQMVGLVATQFLMH